jgi:hypothetical protein
MPICRRHLTTSQRAAIAAEIANMQSGHRSDRPTAKLQEVRISRAEAARAMGVSERSLNPLKHRPLWRTRHLPHQVR